MERFQQNIFVNFQPNILRIVGFYVRHSAYDYDGKNKIHDPLLEFQPNLPHPTQALYYIAATVQCKVCSSILLVSQSED